MRVLLAGASGAIGVPLVRDLLAGGHQVYGLTRTPGNAGRLEAQGVQPVVADAMDRDALLAAVRGLQADAVIHELTDLKRLPMRHRDLVRTNALRETGTANLLAAAQEIGARRFVTQSFFGGYGYGDHGSQLLTEDDPFAVRDGGAFEPLMASMRSAEQQALHAAGIDGVVLRYGAFYGPSANTESVVELLRRRRLPIPRGGGGTISWVYVDDAAAATLAALERAAGGSVYNVVDDEPVSWRDFLGALADAYAVPHPMELPAAIFRAMPYARAFMTSTLRVSNARAKADLGWTLAAPTYRDGIRLLSSSAR